MQNREFFKRVIDTQSVDIEVDASLEVDKKYAYLFSLFIKCDVDEEFLELKEVLITLVGDVYAGFRLVDGWCELYFYVKEPKGVEQKVQKVLQDGKLKYENSIVKDARWDFYHKNLFPSEFEFLLIEGFKIVDELELEGDDITKPREIEHYIFFDTPTQKDRFLSKVEKLGYLYKDEIESDSYGIAIVKEDTLSKDRVLEFTKELYELIKEDRGIYELWSTTLSE